MNINKLKEIVMKYLFLAAACVSILAVALICIFLFDCFQNLFMFFD